MSSQYPPPPQSDEPFAPWNDPPHPHQTSPSQAQQQPPPQLPYSPQSLYPKLENLGDVLQQQAHQATHALGDARNHVGVGAPPPPPPPQELPHQFQPLPHLQQQAQQQRPNRLRKACDSCSIRKVKCDESGPPCRACAALEIPCTFDRPSRRRGPPNRHAEAIKKKRRLDGTDGGSGPSTPASPTNAAHALAQLSSHAPPQLSAESICPVPTMNALIDDFFTHIHPLCPFPHEPSFREAWERREDYTNPPFLALLSAMIACLVASFPRKPRIHLKMQTRDQYPSHLALVDKCREVCAQARGPGYLDSPSLNVYDACTSYFLGLAGAYIFQWRQLRLYFGECLTILRALGLHKASEQGYTFLGGVPGAMGSNGPDYDGSKELKLDRITEQIGKRLFWAVFAGARTMQQLGASFGELTILPSTPSEPLPPLPAEVDDTFIYPDQILPQPPHIVPLISGFNTNVRIYSSYAPLSTAEMAFGSDELFDWDRQQRILEKSLNSVKRVLDDIPDVLKVLPQDSMNGRFGQRRQPYYPPMPEYGHMRDEAAALEAAFGAAAGNGSSGGAGVGDASGMGMQDPGTRRAAQYEIQKANIYASHLSIRSYLVEKYFTLLEKHREQQQQQQQQDEKKEATEDVAAGLDRLVQHVEQPDAQRLEEEMAAEKEQVIKDLLVVLGSIDMVNMEPNGDSFTQKIRQIASTLLEPRHSSTTTTSSRPSSISQQNQEYLHKFLDILARLERVNPDGPATVPAPNPADVSFVHQNGNGAGAVPMDEESELRAWADLREYQLRFQEQGGIYGFAQ